MFRFSNAIRLCLVLGIVHCAAAPLRAADNDFPNRPIRFIVPYPPGGSTDPTARLLAQWFTEKLGQSVVVDNRPGAGATIGHAMGAQATPDGYTWLFGTSGGMVVGPAYGTKVTYDSIKDFAHIGLIADSPFLLVIHPSVPAKSVQELVEAAKAQPGKILFGSPGAGTPNHLGMELLKSLTKAQFVHVPYKGGGPALIDLMSGRIHALFGGITYTGPAIQSGKVRAIAVGHPQRVRAFPDLPTIAEWLPGFNCSTWYGILAPAGTPRAIVTKVNTELRNALASPAFLKQFDTMGLIAVSSTPDELRERIRSELARWNKVIEEAGIRLKG
jgi:tripartite-type tricarboxylate transporter receptor subunit TctC